MNFPKFFLITSSTIAVPGIVFGGLWINKTVRSRIEAINLLKEQYREFTNKWVELQKEKNMLESTIKEVDEKIEKLKKELMKDNDSIKSKKIKRDISYWEKQKQLFKLKHSQQVSKWEKDNSFLLQNIEKIKKQLQKESINVEDIKLRFRSSKFFSFYP